jgi:bifunctional UDP-N-acetylglucosamine pyrophosphorylase/glucosamine-1-phosphate N-acetyltransferase
MGKTMIEYALDQLQGIADEVILVVGYKKEMIQRKIGPRYGKIRIKYVFLKQLTGTGSAAALASKYIKDRFLLLMGDDIYSKDDIKKLIRKFPAIAAQEVKNPKSFGVITHKDRILINLAEKPERPQSNLANTAMYYLSKDIFKYAIGKSARGEYEFTDYVKQFASNSKLNVVISKGWMPVPYVWNLFDVANFLLKKSKKEINGKIDKGVVIKDKVIIGKGTVVKTGVQIQGPVYIGEDCFIETDCVIGPNTVIENNCRVLSGSIIKDCILGAKTTIGKSTVIKNSILGINCKIGNNVKFLNRAKSGTIKVIMQDKLVDTNKKTLGSFLGDSVSIGDNVTISAGIKINPNKKIKTNSQILKDII